MRLSRLSSLALLSFLTLATAIHGSACGGDTKDNQVTPDAGPTPDAAQPSSDASEPLPLVDEDRPLIPASKVDLLLVVDNSASMGDKAAALASSLGTLLRDVAKVGDVHVGVVSSSLGNMGGDICSPANPATNRRAHLAKTGPGGTPVPGSETGVLSYSGGDVDSFVDAASSLVRGVGETGCGFEAQLESAYRFLVQPDPWESVTVDSQGLADLGTTLDVELLVQRKAFLRNDSALVVLMLTDEDDSAADPLSIGGGGWAFMAKNFPGSQVFRRGVQLGTTAARATTTCATTPASADCTSCGFASSCDENDAACQKLRTDPNCTTSPIPGKSGDGYDGYYGPDDDWFNVRFHRMKERFGVDPQFPLSRYIDGFTKSVVPNRRGEHPTQSGANGRREILPYAGTPNCINPIFAESLPSEPGDDICILKRGPRSRELVLFAVLGGVPAPLATSTPDWTKILGQNPDAYDYGGIDLHMIPSIEPRQGLPAPSNTLGDNGPDPIHGREWNTSKDDLQYACTFELPSPKQCTETDSICDCRPDIQNIPPLCGPTAGQQLRAKAYPTLRPLRVAKGLGERGIIGSICANSYDETMSLVSTRLASRLAK